jgi:ubiquinone/menaquinone biosynthesis C-methylase UbiE
MIYLMDSNKQSSRIETTTRPIISQPAICDYEGSSYRTDFWTQDRTYEDAVERIAVAAMLPVSGRRLIEIGVGFGRLVDLYADYDHVVLFDYSRSLLKEAQDRWGPQDPSGRPRYIYVAGDFNRLPFAPSLFDAVTMIRVIHHAPNAQAVLKGVNEITAPGGVFLLEFANKRNIKAISRWLFRQQKWNPFDHIPYEFAELNFDFHPHWIQKHLQLAGFDIVDRRSVSHFRLGLLKRMIPSRLLIRLDRLVQPTGRWWQLTPSVFIKSQTRQTKPAALEGALFRCPICRSTELIEQPEELICQKCHRRWPITNGIYDFKISI